MAAQLNANVPAGAIDSDGRFPVEVARNEVVGHASLRLTAVERRIVEWHIRHKKMDVIESARTATVTSVPQFDGVDIANCAEVNLPP